MTFNKDVSLRLAAIAAISFVVWLAYFSFSSDLGLYQDDVFMYHIVQNARNGVIAEAFDFVRGYSGEGRYGGQILMVLLTGLGKQLGGITGLYIVGWAVLCVLATLAFVFFSHFVSHQASFLAAVFLILFPADTAKFFAVSYMANITGIMFFLAAILALRGQHVLAAISLLATMLIIEPYIPMGVLIPLAILAYNRDDARDARRKALRFFLIYLSLVVPAIVAKLTLAPGRAKDAVGASDKFEFIQKIFDSTFMGVCASASSLYKRIPELFVQGTSSSWTVVAVVLGVLVLILGLSGWRRERSNDPGDSLRGPDLSSVGRQYLVAFGLLACFAAYPLYGMYPARFPPTIIDGKMSNIHLPAAVGFATLLAMLLNELEVRTRQNVVVASRVLVAVYLSLTAGFFAIVQSRYVDSWRYQLSFFRYLPESVPNLHADSLVVVEPIGIDATRLEGGSPFDWTLPYLFQFMWQAPGDWARTPLIVSRYFFDTTAKNRDEYVDIVGYPTLPARSFLQRDVVTLRVQEGRLYSKESDAAPGQGRAFQLFVEDVPAGARKFRPGELQLRAANAVRGGYRSISPNNYTGAGWRNGVMAVQGANNDMFYFIVSSEALNPLLVGDVVEFAHTGTAKITRIDAARQGEKLAVFVQVDRDLSPEKDGFPAMIRFRSP